MRNCQCLGNPLAASSRREFLTVGAMGAMGFALGDLLNWEQARAAQTLEAKSPRAKSILHIFLPGGMSQQESFHPEALRPVGVPRCVRCGKDRVSGEVFSELWPATASVADKLCIVRSMTHGEAAHERGTHNMFTGYRPSPAIMYPSLGSIVSHELGSRADLPPYICVPNVPNPYAGTGYLSSSYGPFSLGADPAQGGFQVRDLALPPGVDAARFNRRRTAMDAVNAHFEAAEKADAIAAMDSFYQQAYSLISSAKAREAFNLNAESAAIRDEYGRNEAGARLLMCRRLIAAGVRVVSVTYGGWDFHVQIGPGTRQQAPAFDRAFAALIRDLDRTGLLQSTIVMVSSEFGRTPKLNGDGGRDHWPRVFSMLLAGGGIARGKIFGSSTATAAEPDSEPIEPGDLFATLYTLLGIDYTKRLLAAGNRPINIVRDGKLRQGLLA